MGFIFFLFNLFTSPNFGLTVVAALVGYILFEFLRKVFSAKRPTLNRGSSAQMLPLLGSVSRKDPEYPPRLPGKSIQGPFKNEDRRR
jgi:hypothetical protein